MPEVRRIAVATFGRSDFSILRPLCRLLLADPAFEVGMWVGGAHFEDVSGRTVGDIEESGIPIWARIEGVTSDRSAIGTVETMADQMTGFAAAASGRHHTRVDVTGPAADLVLILGDRFEAVAAGLAMVPLGIPVGHISGGSITEGAIDDVFRHCLTKIAAIHFCDLPRFARRIHYMGEPTDRVVTTGALGLDALASSTIYDLPRFAERFGLGDLRSDYALATLHPETRRPEVTHSTALSMVEALAAAGRDVVITYPNADPGADEIVDVIEGAASHHDHVHCVRGFGADWFPTAMRHAGVMVGNSSGGIIEAASFNLSVVDIGDRQKGREHGPNVVHCGRGRTAILDAIHEVTSAEFRTMAMSGNIYGDGRGAERVIAALRGTELEALAAPKSFAEPNPDFVGELLELR
jgi:UDP-hydrolysing UDP-N-acetyl-D-glucosamine 2-epimerase